MEGPPKDSRLGAYYTRLILGEYKRPKPFSSDEFKPTQYIFLPIPNEIRDDTTVSWSSSNLETVGDIFNGAISSGASAAVLRNSGNIIKFGGKVMGDAIAAMAGAIGGDGAERVVGGATNTISNLFSPEQITSAIQAETGYAPNPNPVTTFQGPVLRDYSYTWTFYPRNPAESQNVKNVVRILKSNALPQNVVSKSAAILKYPHMAQINFFPWDKGGIGPWYWSDNSIIRYKKSVMTAVNVNYAAFGPPGWFKGTNLPTTIQINISFKELEYMLANDWDPSFEGNKTTTDFLTDAIRSNADTVGGSAQSLANDIINQKAVL